MREYQVNSLVEMADDNRVIKKDLLPDKDGAEWWAKQLNDAGVPAWVVPIEVTES